MNKLAAINSDYAGMGGASAGIMGTLNTNTQLIDTLRRDAAAFAAERSRFQASTTRLQSLAERLEGSLRALQLINAITDKRLDELVLNLRALTNISEGSN